MEELHQKFQGPVEIIREREREKDWERGETEATLDETHQQKEGK